MMESMKNNIVEGATPKVMTSASESSSLPMGDDTCRSRAAIPSKKSNMAPMTIHSNDHSNMPRNAKCVAMQPEMRLQQVMLLGICLMIDMTIIERM